MCWRVDEALCLQSAQTGSVTGMGPAVLRQRSIISHDSELQAMVLQDVKKKMFMLRGQYLAAIKCTMDLNL